MTNATRMSLRDVPPEVIEQIVILADPLDLPALARTARVYNNIINPPNYQRLWQTLYLFQHLDDPRICRDQYGRPSFSARFDWRHALQRIVRARKIVQNPRARKPEERCGPATSFVQYAEPESRNLAWVASLLQHSTFLDAPFPLFTEEEQLRARLLSHFGLTKSGMKRTSLTMSRAYIYNMRNYRQDNHYGPFRPISVGVNRLPGMRVNWVHVQAIHHVMSIPMVPEIYFQKAEPQPGLDKSKSNEDPLNDLPFIRYPISLPYCQSVILEGTDLDDELDWAGVEGLWKHVLCYVDRHHLLSLNRLDTSSVARDRGSVNSPLEGSCFCDKFRTYAVNLYITGSEPDPNHPTRPRLHFQGNDVTGQLFVGWVDYTFDDQIRWYIAFGYNNPLEWSSSGVQVGAVRSPFGVLGGWAAAIHNVFPPIPIGPFWFYKVGDITRGESILNDDA